MGPNSVTATPTALSAGTSGTADTVHILLGDVWKIEVHDVTDSGNIYPAGSNGPVAAEALISNNNHHWRDLEAPVVHAMVQR